MTAYLTTTGPKHDTRRMFSDAVARHIEDPSNILLMPGEEAHDARILKEAFPRVKVTGIDNSREKAGRIASEQWRFIDQMISGSVHRYADTMARENPGGRQGDLFPRMDAIWLDHTGGCTARNVTDLVRLVHYAAKDECVVAATFCANARTGADSADSVIRHNAWIDARCRYDGAGQRWAEAKLERAVFNTPANVANAVRTAIEKGHVGEYQARGGRTSCQGARYSRLEVLDCVNYNATSTSVTMFFFILYVKRL